MRCSILCLASCLSSECVNESWVNGYSRSCDLKGMGRGRGSNRRTTYLSLPLAWSCLLEKIGESEPLSTSKAFNVAPPLHSFFFIPATLHSYQPRGRLKPRPLPPDTYPTTTPYYHSYNQHKMLPHSPSLPVSPLARLPLLFPRLISRSTGKRRGTYLNPNIH